jgi:hypothetical protein
VGPLRRGDAQKGYPKCWRSTRRVTWERRNLAAGSRSAEAANASLTPLYSQAEKRVRSEMAECDGVPDSLGSGEAIEKARRGRGFGEEPLRQMVRFVAVLPALEIVAARRQLVCSRLRAVAYVLKVRGRLSDPRHIELDEPVDNLTGPVDVVIQEAEPSAAPALSRGFIGLCADLGPAPSADEIDEARRDLWAGFPRDDI